MTRIWAVVPAAGSGSRLGADTPKQFLPLHGRSLLYWSLDTLLSYSGLAGCMVALPAGATSVPADAVPDDVRLHYCPGGGERSDSVAAALDALPADPQDWVMVHDAARPCLARADIERLVDSVMATGVGGLLAEPVTDTLKRADAQSRVTETVDRRHLWRAQTPQMFRVGELRQALASARAAGYAVTDEASAMEFQGHAVQLVKAGAGNIKVTYASDLDQAAFLLSRRQSATVRDGGPAQAGGI